MFYVIMPGRTRIATLTRMKGQDGATLCFLGPGDGRHRQNSFISVDRVPDFEGDEAVFELEKVREPDCPWPRWRVIRRVQL